MGKNRQKANLTSNSLIATDIVNDRIGINSTSPTTTLDVNGTVTATSLVKSGGTSSQYLMADGSVSTGGGGGGGVTTGKAIAMAMVFGWYL